MFNFAKRSYNIAQAAGRRFFNLGGQKVYAKTGTTAKGVKWTKLYSSDGELISWKNSLNGRVKKGKYERVDVYDKGIHTEYPRPNQKLTTVKYTGFEEMPVRSNGFDMLDDINDPLNIANRYNPMSPYYESPEIPSFNDPFSNPWDSLF